MSRERYLALYIEASRGNNVDLEREEAKLPPYVIFKARQRARRQIEREKVGKELSTIAGLESDCEREAETETETESE